MAAGILPSLRILAFFDFTFELPTGEPRLHALAFAQRSRVAQHLAPAVAGDAVAALEHRRRVERAQRALEPRQARGAGLQVLQEGEAEARAELAHPLARGAQPLGRMHQAPRPAV